MLGRCRERGIPRSLDEIPSYSGASRRDVARCYRKIVRELGLRGPLPSPADSVPRMCERLGLSHVTVRRAMEIVERARELNLVKKPETMAAASAYLAARECGEPGTQRTAAVAAGASEVSLRKARRELGERPGLPIPTNRR